VGKINGEVVDSWIYNLSTYFKTFTTLTKENKVQITSLELEVLAHTWWDTHLENTTLVVDIGPYDNSSESPIKTWEQFCHALRDCFYPPNYLQNLWTRWLQLRQLPTQNVHSYIDYFCKLRIQLHISYLEEVFILKFNLGLLSQFRIEVDLFEHLTLDKYFE